MEKNLNNYHSQVLCLLTIFSDFFISSIFLYFEKTFKKLDKLGKSFHYAKTLSINKG